MPRDYARTRKPAKTRTKKANTRQPARPAKARANSWQWYSAGLLSGVFLSFLLYLGTLPPGTGASTVTADVQAGASTNEPPKPKFDFYTLLSEQAVKLRVEPAPAGAATPPATKSTEFYMLQAGSFKQHEDADRRRAELLLLGLEPKVEETNGDNGRWFRVYLGPFQSRSTLNKARSLTAGQNIDTLVLKRRRT